MLLSEPPSTQYDLQFSIFGFPVRVHPLFFLGSAILGLSLGNMFFVIEWILVCFVSILVHELGHALAMRYYGSGARIVLYLMGGLAIPESSWGFRSGKQSPNSQIIISAAGPIAGFILAAVIVAIIFLSGGDFRFRRGIIFWTFSLPFEVINRADENFLPSNSEMLYVLFHAALFVNILWGLVNLLPIYPLDGGQISREIFTKADAWRGTRNSLILSAVVAAAVAVFGLYNRQFFIGIFFGLMAYQSWQGAQNMGGGGGYGGRPW